MFKGSGDRLFNTTLYGSTIVLVLAAMLDYLLGDPRGWWHPVQGMGWVITHGSQIAFRFLQTPIALRWAGVILGGGLIVGSGAAGWLLVAIAHQTNLLLGTVTASVLLASCFAGRSLRAAAADVFSSLNAGDLVNARLRLSQYVGRDTDRLSKPEIVRAVFETVTENATDGVLAPLFWSEPPCRTLVAYRWHWRTRQPVHLIRWSATVIRLIQIWDGLAPKQRMC
jgi:adenosylcobinamide-phosphate synthase